MELNLHGGEYGIKDGNDKHWMCFKDDKLIGENNRFYLTVTIDMKNNAVEVFSSGNSIGKNICNETYLDKKEICNEKIPFVIGVQVWRDELEANYSHFKLYGCRLYDRVLSNDEIKQNYEESKDLLND